jgi:hypothetical protein
VTKSRRLQWARNVTAMEKMRNAWKISVGKPEENRPLESLRHMKE